MWSSHLFRTFCRKVYRPNCQCCQGVQRFEKNYQEKPLWVSRTLRATSCATPRFFNFLSIFVSGQTCGQATYFEHFVEKYTARIVRFFKGFSDFQKSLLQDRWRCPERCALPAALRLEFFCLIFLFKATGRLAVPKRRYARAPPRQSLPTALRLDIPRSVMRCKTF